MRAGRTSASHDAALLVQRLEQQHLGRRPGRAVQAQAGRDHPGVVEHDQVAWLEQFGQVGARAVLGRARPPVDEQPCRVARLDRRLRDPLRRQLVVEVVKLHRSEKATARPVPPFSGHDREPSGTGRRRRRVVQRWHVWTPASGSGPALLLIQEIFGVGPYICAVAERLAEAGYVVGEPDMFWRFAPGWSATHDESGLNASIGLMSQFDFPAAVGDCVAACGALAALAETTGTPGVIGFCLGGTLGFAVAALIAVGVRELLRRGVPDMVGMLDQMTCPVLFDFGSHDDPYIPNEKRRGVERGDTAGRSRHAC